MLNNCLGMEKNSEVPRDVKILFLNRNKETVNLLNFQKNKRKCQRESYTLFCFVQ